MSNKLYIILNKYFDEILIRSKKDKKCGLLKYYFFDYRTGSKKILICSIITLFVCTGTRFNKR